MGGHIMTLIWTFEEAWELWCDWLAEPPTGRVVEGFYEKWLERMTFSQLHDRLSKLRFIFDPGFPESSEPITNRFLALAAWEKYHEQQD